LNSGDGPNRASVQVIQEILGDMPESARMYEHMAQLRMEAESVPELMEPYANYPGYRSYYKNYYQVLDATSRLCAPAGERAQDIFASVDGAGWIALEFADEVLRTVSTEKKLSMAQQRRYLDDLRGLIDDVLSDETMSPQDKQRVVGLLRQVEDALVHIRLFGADRVEDAAIAAAAVIQSNPNLRTRIANKKWARKLGVLIVGLLFALAEDAGQAAIEQAFGTEDQPQIVAQQDQENGHHRQDQPIDQPTPR
jgi:hypothetical protein